MRLGHDQLRLPLGGVAGIGRRLLGSHEGRREQVLPPTNVLELLRELVDLVGQLSTLAPDVLEAGRNLVEQALGRIALVSEQRASEADVSQFDWAIGHGLPVSFC